LESEIILSAKQTKIMRARVQMNNKQLNENE